MGAEEKGSHKERVEAMQKKFDVSMTAQTVYIHTYDFSNVQTFVTDLAAMSGRVKDISGEAEKMVRTGHSQAREIQTRQQQLKHRCIHVAELQYKICRQQCVQVSYRHDLRNG